MKKLMMVSIFVCYATCVAQISENWEEYTIKGSEMYARFPGEPQASSQRMDTELGTLTLHVLTYSDANINYTISYTDYPADSFSEVSVDSFFISARDGAISKMDGTFIAQKDDNYGEYPGMELKFSIMNERSMVRARYILVGNRFFQALVVSDPLNIYSDPVERFFNSLRLTENAGKSFIERLLIAIGYTYEKTDNEKIHLTMSFEDERTQLVRIYPFTSAFSDAEVYDIWSVISNDTLEIPDSLYREMFIKSGDTDIGRFQIFPADSIDLLVYSAVYEGDLDQEILVKIINDVAIVADIYEDKITGKDDY